MSQFRTGTTPDHLFMMATDDLIFAAVFPHASDADLPTPAATPVLGSSGFGESFGNISSQSAAPVTGAAEQIKWDRAWHTATTYLTLPDDPITVAHTRQEEDTLRGKWIKTCSPDVTKAITYIVSDSSYGRQLRKNLRNHDLLIWYYKEVGSRHYLEYVMPGLLKALEQEETSGALFEVVAVLQVAQAIYLHPVRNHIIPLLPDAGAYELSRLVEAFHSLFAYSLCQPLSLTQQGLLPHLQNFLQQRAFNILRVGKGSQAEEGSGSMQQERRSTLRFIQSLNGVGLGGAKAQRVFAEVMSNALSNHVQSAYAGRWTSPSTVPEELRGWIENQFARFIVEILDILRDEDDGLDHQPSKVTLADVEKWQEMGINKLGTLRTRELFDIIVDWDHGSQGAIEDLKRYVTNTSARMRLTTSFTNVLSHRLLQPGASTTEILQVYIAIIRAFAVLDSKGVLLDRVARPVRRYLRERDDTVSIVVGGLLADPEDETNDPDVLVELAMELNKLTNLSGEEEIDDGELDWDDMSWMPDPVDAGPDYKKSKHSDVIGSLISLFDSKDIFVKEFQKILGDRLLRREYDFDKEIRVLELLKLRFGEAALQACEVMLRDILDSRRVDNFIRIDQKLELGTSLHARILSHLFWPPLHSETFSIPSEIATLQSRYAIGFETRKQSRKLTWLNALGQVIVQLDLEDRTVIEEVQTWQASVIYAFQTHDAASSISKTVQQLIQELEMSELLVRNALNFWVSMLVLRESSPDTYYVLETLSSSEMDAGNMTQSVAAAAAATVATANPANAIAEDHAFQEKMVLSWQCVVAMLTNQGSMPLPQILAYLGEFVPGGFPFGNEVLREFLDGKVQEGKLELVQGGNYKIVK